MLYGVGSARLSRASEVLALRYISTRGQASPLEFDDVLLEGLARDGGLYVPESWPAFAEDIADLAGKTYGQIACGS